MTVNIYRICSNPRQIGTDNTSGFVWSNELPGNNTANYFNYVIGNYNNYLSFVDRSFDEVIGYDGNPTKALSLEFKQYDSSFTSLSRVQYDICEVAYDGSKAD